MRVPPVAVFVLALPLMIPSLVVGQSEPAAPINDTSVGLPLSDQNAIPEVTVVLSESGELLELRYGDTAMPSDFLSGFGSGGFSSNTTTFFAPVARRTRRTEEKPVKLPSPPLLHHRVLGE